MKLSCWRATLVYENFLHGGMDCGRVSKIIGTVYGGRGSCLCGRVCVYAAIRRGIGCFVAWLAGRKSVQPAVPIVQSGAQQQWQRSEQFGIGVQPDRQQGDISGWNIHRIRVQCVRDAFDKADDCGREDYFCEDYQL